LRSLWEKSRGGSSPLDRTIFIFRLIKPIFKPFPENRLAQ